MDEKHAVAVKLTTIWTAVGFSKLGINSWSDVAAICASIYSLLLIGRLLWHWFKVWRNKEGR
ncbi:MAG TPA: hypothetical protein PLW13_16040 [Pseudomonadales bacterium]|nr:hypothetical protein [Pseudomonadales bacterium]